MSFNYSMALFSIVMGSIVFNMGIILKKKPTKIGHINGFRNKYSIKNQEQWDFSQKVFAENLIKYSWIPFLTSLLGFFINKHNTPWGLLGIMTIFLVSMALASFKTRDRINLEFEKKEND